MRLDESDAQLTLAQREADLNEIKAQKRAEERGHSANQAALEREQRILEIVSRAQQRASMLAQNKVGSESVLDDARAQVQSSHLAVNSRQERIDTFDARMAQLTARELRAQAGIDTAKRDIERSIVTAPFDGRVTAVNVSPGERVRAGDALISLYDVDVVELRAQVPERYLAQLRSGQQQAVVATSELDNKPLTLHLDRFAGKVARGRGGVDALFRLASTDVTPDIGRTVSTTVSLPVVDNVCPIPASAMVGNNRVYVVDDNNRLRAITVTRVGNFVDDKGINQLLVKSPDIRQGARLVVSQLPSAVDGLLVNPIQIGQH